MIERIYETPCGPIHYWVGEAAGQPEQPALVLLPGLTEQNIPAVMGRIMKVWEASPHDAGIRIGNFASPIGYKPLAYSRKET